MSGSPLVVEGQVIVTPGGAPGRSVMAFDCRDGRLVWSAGDDPAAYASPACVQLAGQLQLLSFNGAGLRGFATNCGQPLWLYPWVTQGERQRVNVAQPIVVTPSDNSAPDEGLVLVSSGYEMGMSLLRVSAEQGDWQVTEVWHSRGLRSKMSNFVVHDESIYGFDSGILACLDLRDGQRVWKGGRYGHGQILLVGDLLLIQAETGEVVLVRATPQGHEELARLEALPGKTWNHAALAGNVLVVRNDREAAAFELPEQTQDPDPVVARSALPQSR
jgi:outer membrane protein assembly factor BamB